MNLLTPHRRNIDPGLCERGVARCTHFVPRLFLNLSFPLFLDRQNKRAAKNTGQLFGERSFSRSAWRSVWRSAWRSKN
ncbi:hypothetical protein BpHYR1_015634 [Brachionus plicatilis]|uniref:Uncharacterized protein n=1 Tax=Brachionus plicatilis TaxID=10195 RepID=A0A3M7PYQ2_BRAPC|nr:hypothetical protein BpHYR1_015634 [Brachionus plicatilis]